jgi:transposase InsO family protein
MCRWLQVSKSGYYGWLHRPPSATTWRRELLPIKVRALFDASDGTYGYRRLPVALVNGGEQVGPELVRELMRELVWPPASPGRGGPPPSAAVSRAPLRTWWAATSPLRRQDPNLSATSPRSPPGPAGLYLATVIDCFNKEVIGYAMADHLRTSLICDALEMAARNHPIHLSRIRGELAHLECGNPWAAPGVVTLMRWRNPFSSPSK